MGSVSQSVNPKHRDSSRGTVGHVRSAGGDRPPRQRTMKKDPARCASICNHSVIWVDVGKLLCSAVALVAASCSDWGW